MQAYKFEGEVTESGSLKLSERLVLPVGTRVEVLILSQEPQPSVPAAPWMAFAGMIANDEAQALEAIIRADCEQVNDAEW